jgi:L-malate glycosyltransferase
VSARDTLRSVHVDTERTWGGGQRQVAWLAEGLAQLGHPTCVMARPSQPYGTRLSASDVAVLPLAPRTEFDPLAARRIHVAARRTGARLVVAHAGHAAALAALATLGTDLRLVVTRRVALPLGRSPFSRWKHRRAALVIAVSERVREVLVADGVRPERIQVVHSGVDLKRPASPVDDATLEALGLAPDRPLAVMVSSLDPPHKDPLSFLRAIAAARRSVPELQGLLVGGGRLLGDALRERAALGLDAVVAIAGRRADAERLLATGTVAMLTSRDEGLGTTLLDAMLWGVPVVATAAGGVREIVRDGTDGLLSAPGDASALAGNVVRVLTQGDLRARLVASARERVRAFSVERTVADTIDAYWRALYSGPC